MTTGKQGRLQRGRQGHRGGYINDDGDTKNVRLAITINNAQGQSLEKCGIDLDTDCFSHGQLYVACSRVGKSDNLLYAQTMGQRRMLYIRKFYVAKYIYIYKNKVVCLSVN